MILDPEGRELVEKPAEDSETILYAEVDLSLCEVARVSFRLPLPSHVSFLTLTLIPFITRPPWILLGTAAGRMVS